MRRAIPFLFLVLAAACGGEVDAESIDPPADAQFSFWSCRLVDAGCVCVPSQSPGELQSCPEDAFQCCLTDGETCQCGNFQDCCVHGFERVYSCP